MVHKYVCVCVPTRRALSSHLHTYIRTRALRYGTENISGMELRTFALSGTRSAQVQHCPVEVANSLVDPMSAPARHCPVCLQSVEVVTQGCMQKFFHWGTDKRGGGSLCGMLHPTLARGGKNDTRGGGRSKVCTGLSTKWNINQRS